MQETGHSRHSTRTIKPVVAVAAAAVAAALLLATGGLPADGTLAGPPESIYKPDVEPAAALAIGRVTDEQMRSTLHDVAACASEAGFETELVEFVPGLRWHLETDLGSNEDHDLAERASAALEACNASVAATVDAYVAQNQLSSTEQVAFEDRIRACMAQRGVVVAPEQAPALANGVNAGPAFHDCQAEVYLKPGT